MDTKIGSRIIANNAAAQPKAGGVVAPVESDTELRDGGPWYKVEEMSSADQDTIEGNGIWNNKLRGTGGPGGGVDVENEGTPLAGGPFDTLDFSGGGVTATDAGGGTATITIPGGGAGGVELENEGTPLAGGPFDTLDFSGSGVTAIDAGGGTATITIPGGGISGLDLQNEGTPLAGGPFDTLNFAGAGVTATDGGGGIADITIPGGGAADTVEVLALSAVAPVVLSTGITTSILTGSPAGECIATLAAGTDGASKTIIVVGIDEGTDVVLVISGTAYQLLPNAGDSQSPGAIYLRYGNGRWNQSSAAVNFASGVEGFTNVGAQVQTDGTSITGLGVTGDPLVVPLRAPQANTYNGNSGDTVPLDPTDDVSFLQCGGGGGEGTFVTFTLGDGTIDGHQISLTTNYLSSTDGIHVDVIAGGGSFTIQIDNSSTGPSGAVLAWNGNAGIWNIVSLLALVLV